MDSDRALQMATELLAPWTRGSTQPEPNRLDIGLGAEDLVSAVSALRQARWGYLAAITGLDRPGPPSQILKEERWSQLAATTGVEVTPGEIEVLYHFCNGAAVVTLRVVLPRSAPSVHSICGLIPAASFFERELREMFGVTMLDGCNSDHLFLPDDWPTGVYPLRKDFIAASERG